MISKLEHSSSMSEHADSLHSTPSDVKLESANVLSSLYWSHQFPRTQRKNER